MTSDRKLASFQQWALAVLGLLSATSDDQTSYLQESGTGTDELLLQFDDVLHVAQSRVADGSLKHEEFDLLLKVSGSVDAVNSESDLIWDESALKEAYAWKKLRIRAGEVKMDLERSWNLNSEDC
ncbi:hypothetical protein [Streptomyces sp. NPDC004100]